MTEDTEEFDMNWGGSIRDLFSAPFKRGKARVLRKPRVVVLQNRAITTDTQTFDTLQNINGLFANQNLRMQDAQNITGVVLDLDGVLTDVGDACECFAIAQGVDAAGNIGSINGMMVVIEWAKLHLQNGGAAANRTMQLEFYGGGVQRAWGAPAPEYASTVSAAVIANQYGGVFAWKLVETTTVNGAVTAVVGMTPFPVLCRVQNATVETPYISSNVANIAALDWVCVSMLVRRVG